jgi:hypothetical protein
MRAPGEDPLVRAPIRPSSTPGRGAARASGLAVLVGIVLVGLVTGAGFYRYQRGKMDARLAAELARAPKTPAERAALWLRYGGPQIHHRLAVVGRFAPERPWLVTHAVARSGGAPELWGIDCASLGPEIARLEGLTVVVELPAPRVLARAELTGEPSQRVPVYAEDVSPDAARRLSELALYLLEGIPGALERDVPGAKLEVRVAGE